MTQKTAVIWDTVGEEEIKFFLVDYDITELSKVYVNMSCNDEDEKRKDARLANIVFDDNGNTLVEFVSVEEFENAVRNGAKVIVCGFLP